MFALLILLMVVIHLLFAYAYASVNSVSYEIALAKIGTTIANKTKITE